MLTDEIIADLFSLAVRQNRGHATTTRVIHHVPAAGAVLSHNNEVSPDFHNFVNI
jgi:hypothetical protein